MEIPRNKNGSISWSDETIQLIIDGLIEWLLKDPDNIFIGEFLVNEVGISSLRFLEKLRERPYLGKEYRKVKDIQEYKLLKDGLLKRYDSSLVKFVLSNKFNYAEKAEIDFKGVNLKELISFDDE